MIALYSKGLGKRIPIWPSAMIRWLLVLSIALATIAPGYAAGPSCEELLKADTVLAEIALKAPDELAQIRASLQRILHGKVALPDPRLKPSPSEHAQLKEASAFAAAYQRSPGDTLVLLRAANQLMRR